MRSGGAAAEAGSAAQLVRELQIEVISDHTGTHAPRTVIGACAFWLERGQWRLRWVWVCPKMRRTGALAHRWLRLLERYGDFEVEAPLSGAMHNFVLAHGTSRQRVALNQKSRRTNPFTGCLPDAHRESRCAGASH